MNDQQLKELLQSKKAENSSLLTTPNDEWEKICQSIEMEDKSIHKNSISKSKIITLSIFVLVFIGAGAKMINQNKISKEQQVVAQYLDSFNYYEDSDAYDWIALNY